MTKIFLGLKRIKFEEKSQFLNKEVDGLSSVQRTNTVAYGQSLAYGTLLNSCSYNTLEPKYFYLIHQLGGT